MKSIRHISLRYQFMVWVGLAVTLSVLVTGGLIQVRVKKNLEKQVAAS